MKKKYINRYMAALLAASLTLSSLPVYALSSITETEESQYEQARDAQESSEADETPDMQKEDIKENPEKENTGLQKEGEESSEEAGKTENAGNDAVDADKTAADNAGNTENPDDRSKTENKNAGASKTAVKEAKGQDFSSRELIVRIAEDEVEEDADIIGQYEDVYVLKYKSAAKAKEAFIHYYDRTEGEEFVAVNSSFRAAAAATSVGGQEEENTLEAWAEAEEKDSRQISFADTIALIDTGAGLSANVFDRVSMLGEDGSDDNGHGSSMVESMLSVNPRAHILSIKALDADGRGDAASVYAAIEYAIERNVRIINLSLCGKMTQENAALTAAVQDALDAGVIVVGAAGNDSTDVKDYLPGSIPDILIAGACDKEGKKLDSSNYGETVDYYVYADSSSEAAARLSALIALKGIGGISEVINQGLIFQTHYADDKESRDSAPEDEASASGSEAAGSETEDTSENSDEDRGEDGFLSALTLAKTGIGSMSGYRYTIVDANIDKNHSTIISGEDDWALKTYKFSNGYRSGLYHKTKTISDYNSHTFSKVSGGGVTIRVKNGAKDAMGYHDLDITLSDIYVRTCSHIYDDGYENKYIPLLVGNPYDTTSEAESSLFSFKSCGQAPGGCAMRFTVKYSVVGAASTEKLAIAFRDLDVRGCNGGKLVFADDVSDSAYLYGIEGITIKSGVDKTFVEGNTVLSIKNSNTEFYATQATGDGSSVSEKRAGVGMVGSASAISFIWSGSSCGTPMGGLSANLIDPYTAKLYVRRQKADGSWPAYPATPTKSMTLFKGQSIDYTWTDTAVGYGNVKKGTGDASSAGMTVSKRTATIKVASIGSNLNYYLDVPRTNVTYSFDFNIPGELSDEGWTVDSLKEKKYFSGSQEDFTKLYGSQADPVMAEELKGYDFLGWNTMADGSGDYYTGSSEVTYGDAGSDYKTMTLDRKFYAQWKEKPGKESLTVLSEETGSPMEGITFQLYRKSDEGEEKIGTPVSTDIDGRVSFDGLSRGDYLLKCENVPAGYKLPENIGFSLSFSHPENEDELVLYMKHVQVVLDAKVTDILPGENAPSFVYHIEGVDAAGVAHSYTVMVDVNEAGLTGSNATKDMFAGSYTVTQTENERYIADTAENVENSRPDGIKAEVELYDDQRAETLFHYHIKNYGWFTSMHSKVNELTAG